ncbi:MAG: hypothetical protein WKG03_05365 [Telluria sp.]
MGLHGATLGTRFLFIFFLAKNLDPSLVGYYGLFTVTVGYSLYFVGLDFYTYATRELLNTPIEQRGRMLKGQVALSGVLYLLFLPVAMALLLQFSGWPQYLLWWFVPILILEHFNQEMFRLLIALSEQISASVILFIRQGSWALAAVALMAWDPAARNLQNVMALWALAGIAAAGAAIWKLRRLHMGGWRAAVDWSWIRKGIAISTAFLLSTLALRGIQTFDRYLLEALGGIDIVGAYVLFFGVAGTLLTFLDAGIFAFTYPILIKLQQAQETDVARAKVRRMFGLTIVLSAGFGLVTWFLLPYLLVWIDKPVYTGSINLYGWLLTATIINAISMVPHYALYAAGCDRPIIRSHIAALIVFLSVTWMLSGRLSALAVPIGLNLSFALILVWKYASYWRLDQSKAGPAPAPQTT